MSNDPFNPTADPFMEGGGGYPGVALDMGDTVSGIVLAVKEKVDTEPGTGTVKTWPNGDPKKVWIFELDTDGTDDGMRSLWVRGNMVKAIREATQAAGFKSVIGTKLTLQHHALGEKKSGLNQAKLYRAKVESAPARAAAANTGGDEPW